MKFKYINVNPNIMRDMPVFTGTRVPVISLFWHLEKGITIEAFLEDFPSVKRKQVEGVLQIAGKFFKS